MDYSPWFFYHWISRQKGSIVYVMLLEGFIRYYGIIFSRGCWHFTMNVTLMILFFTSICIKQIIVLCSSIMPILLMVVILWMLMTSTMLLSTIFLVDTGWSPFTPTFWIIFSRDMWLTLYKQTIKISNKNIVRKICNAWKTFDFKYYWPACQKKICRFVNIFYSLQFLFQQFEFCVCLQVIFYHTD